MLEALRAFIVATSVVVKIVLGIVESCVASVGVLLCFMSFEDTLKTMEQNGKQCQ